MFASFEQKVDSRAIFILIIKCAINVPKKCTYTHAGPLNCFAVIIDFHLSVSFLSESLNSRKYHKITESTMKKNREVDNS